MAQLATLSKHSASSGRRRWTSRWSGLERKYNVVGAVRGVCRCSLNGYASWRVRSRRLQWPTQVRWANLQSPTMASQVAALNWMALSQVPVEFCFRAKHDTGRYCKDWLRAIPSSGAIKPGRPPTLPSTKCCRRQDHYWPCPVFCVLQVRRLAPNKVVPYQGQVKWRKRPCTHWNAWRDLPEGMWILGMAIGANMAKVVNCMPTRFALLVHDISLLHYRCVAAIYFCL